MTTSMKINKEQYLAKCKQALENLQAPEKEYLEAKAKYEAELKKWADSIIAKKQLRFTGSPTYGLPDFRPAPGAPTPPKEPDHSVFYKRAGLDTSHWRGYNSHKENAEKLREVITLIEMTDSDTIGVSVANKVSHLL